MSIFRLFRLFMVFILLDRFGITLTTVSDTVFVIAVLFSYCGLVGWSSGFPFTRVAAKESKR